MYTLQQSVLPDGTPQPNLFSTLDEKWHAKMLKPIGPYISSTKSVLSTEKFLDSSINLLISVLKEKFVSTALPCDIADIFIRCKSPRYILYFVEQALTGVDFQSHGTLWVTLLSVLLSGFSMALLEILRSS